MAEPLDWPTIPSPAWTRAIGRPAERVGRPRVAYPMIDDGAWAGVPVGGMGAGSIGRTYRGDFRRWHLTVGEHRVETVAADAFSVFVGSGTSGEATILTALGPAGERDWGREMPVGGGTYHALFPRAWFDYTWDGLPIRLLEEQLAPVIPGDLEASALPVGTFTFSLDNPTPERLTVGLLLTWLDGLGRERGVVGPARQVPRETAGGDGRVVGVEFRTGPTDGGMPASLAIAVEGGPGIRVSWRTDLTRAAMAGLWADFAADGALDGPGSPAEPGDVEDPTGGRAAALAATVELAPGERRRIRFAIGWDLPYAVFDGLSRARRYTAEWGTAGDHAFALAATAIRRADAWRAAIEAWQGPILADPLRPEWYRAALFNELYFLVDGGTLWTDDGDGGIGRFGLLECFDYPFYDTLDVDFSASWALLRLYPELERSVIRAFAASIATADRELVTIETSGEQRERKVAGAAPHDLGGPDERPFERINRYRFRDPNTWKDLNSKFVLRLARDVAVLGDRALATEAWPAVCAAIDHLAATDLDGDALPDHTGEPDQTYDTWPMSGPSAYCGGLWLAALRAAIDLAEGQADRMRAATWRALLDRAAASFDRRLWNGRWYAYDAGGGPSADSLMADQLAGQWCADTLGHTDLLPPDRVDSALRHIFERNVAGFCGGEMGAVNGTRPDGSVDRSSDQSEEVWVGTTYALAALLIGRGFVEEGWQTARGVARVTYERGLWFRTPEAYDEHGNFRASLYLRPLAIWAIEDALERARRS